MTKLDQDDPEFGDAPPRLIEGYNQVVNPSKERSGCSMKYALFFIEIDGLEQACCRQKESSDG